LPFLLQSGLLCRLGTSRYFSIEKEKYFAPIEWKICGFLRHAGKNITPWRYDIIIIIQRRNMSLHNDVLFCVDDLKKNCLCTEMTLYTRVVVYLFILYYIGVPAPPRRRYLSEYTRVFMIWPFWKRGWRRGLHTHTHTHTHNPSLKLEQGGCIYTLTHTVVVNKGNQEKTVFRKFDPYVI